MSAQNSESLGSSTKEKKRSPKRSEKLLTLLDIGGGGGGGGVPKNGFDHCAETLQSRKLKLSGF